MSFHLYIEPELEAQVEFLCKQTGRKRNALVREAVREYVEKRLAKEWSETIFDFKPDRNLPRFESLRGDLLADRESIFSDGGQ